MSKKIKISLLFFVLLFFVTGCGWDDVQKEYKDTLKKGVSCKYYTEIVPESNDYFGIKTLELSADYDGVYAKFNSRKKQLLYGTNGSSLYAEFNKTGFSFSTLEDFLKKYQSKGGCPERIYISRQLTNGHEVRVESCEGYDFYCDSYSLKRSETTTPEGEKIDCHYSSATTCEKYVKTPDNLGRKYYIEIGYYNQNGETKKYFGIATDANYNDFQYDVDGTDIEGWMVYINLTYFTITPDAEEELWLSNNKLISSNDLKVTADLGTSTLYYLSGPKSASTGGTYDGGNIEDVPNTDPENQTLSTNTINTKLNYNSICSNDGIKSAVKVIGIIIQIVRWVVPLIIIILGMIDFGKAVFANDEKAISKSSASLLRKFIAGIVIFIIPTLIISLLEGIEISKGITDETNTQFGQCTKCLFAPFNKTKCPD